MTWVVEYQVSKWHKQILLKVGPLDFCSISKDSPGLLIAANSSQSQELLKVAYLHYIRRQDMIGRYEVHSVNL